MQGMRDLLRDSLRQSLSGLQPFDRLAAAWPVACGRALAERGEIAGLIEGVVEVQVSGALWLSQMMTMRSTLQHDLARISGVPLTGIHFKLKQDHEKRGRWQAP